MNEEKLKALYGKLNEGGLYTKDYDTFKTTFSDEGKRQKLYEKLNSGGLYTKDYDTFNSTFFSTPEAPQVEEPLKKKDDAPSFAESSLTSTNASAKTETPAAEVEKEDGGFMGAVREAASVGRSLIENSIPASVSSFLSAYTPENAFTAGPGGYNPMQITAPKADKAIREGAKQESKAQLKIALEKDKQASKLQAVDSLEEIKTPGDFGKYVFNTIVQAGVQIPATILTMGGSSFIQEAGSNYLEGVKEVAKREGITPLEVVEQKKDEKLIPLAFGTAAAALDKIGAKGVAKAISSSSIVKEIRKKTIDVLKSGAKEALTETGQEVLSETSKGLSAGDSLPEAVGNIDPKSLANAAAGGFFGGGGISTAGNVVGSVLDAAAPKSDIEQARDYMQDKLSEVETANKETQAAKTELSQIISDAKAKLQEQAAKETTVEDKAWYEGKIAELEADPKKYFESGMAGDPSVETTTGARALELINSVQSSEQFTESEQSENVNTQPIIEENEQNQQQAVSPETTGVTQETSRENQAGAISENIPDTGINGGDTTLTQDTRGGDQTLGNQIPKSTGELVDILLPEYYPKGKELVIAAVEKEQRGEKLSQLEQAQVEEYNKRLSEYEGQVLSDAGGSLDGGAGLGGVPSSNADQSSNGADKGVVSPSDNQGLPAQETTQINQTEEINGEGNIPGENQANSSGSASELSGSGSVTEPGVRQPNQPNDTSRVEQGNSTSERRIREHWNKVQNTPELSDEVKQALDTDDVRYYDAITNEGTVKAAKELISGQGGVMGALAMVKEPKGTVLENDIALRNATSFIVASELDAMANRVMDSDPRLAEDYLRQAVSVLDSNIKLGTQLGQGLQSFVIWRAMFSNETSAKRFYLSQTKKAKEKALKKAKPELDLARELNKENEAAIEQVLQAGKVSQIKTKNITAASDRAKAAKERIRKEREELKKELLALNKAQQNMGIIYDPKRQAELQMKYNAKLARYGLTYIKEGIIDFKQWSSKMVEDLGEWVKPYLLDTWETAPAGRKRTLEQIARKAELDALPPAERAKKWEDYKREAAEKIANRFADPKTQSEKNATAEFFNHLTSTIKKKFESKKEKPEFDLDNKLALMGEAVKNFDSYKEVWEDARNIALKKYPGKESEIDSYFGQMLDNPFTAKEVEQIVREGLKADGEKIDNIIRQHYTVAAQKGSDLAKKLVEKAGLSEVEASELSSAIQSEFNRVATKRKVALLNKKYGVSVDKDGNLVKKEKGKKNPKREFFESVIELTNLGSLDDSQYSALLAEKMGLPGAMTPEISKKISSLVEAINSAKGEGAKVKAIIDMMDFIRLQKGLSASDIGFSMWTAGIFSGISTQGVNITSNITNTLFEGIVTARNPRDLAVFASALFDGYKRGIREAGKIIKTGYTTHRGDISEAARTLELSKWGNVGLLLAPIPGLRYKDVFRYLSAMDAMSYMGLKNGREALLVRDQGKKLGLKGKELRLYVAEQMGSSQMEWQQAYNQAKSEGLTGNASKRRAWEILEEKRDEKIREEAGKYAAANTFTEKPKGYLGILSNRINQLIKEVPGLKLILPVVNTVANVANRTIDYTPIGYHRAAFGYKKEGYQGENGYERGSREYYDRLTRATIGSVLMLSAYFLLSEDEEGENELSRLLGKTVKLHGNGTADRMKNFQLQETGWRPFSLQVGDNYYNYKYTPIGLALGIMGIVEDGKRFGKLDDSAFDRFALALFSSNELFTSMSFLSSLNEFIKGISDIRTGGNYVEKFGTNLATSVVPNFPKQVEQFFDPKIYDNKTVEQKLTRSIPILRGEVNKPMVNVLGEELEKYPGEGNLWTTKTDKAIWDFIAGKRFFITKVKPDSEAARVWKEEKQVPMDDDEFYEFSRRRGEIIKERIREMLEELKQMDSAQLDKIRRDIMSDATMQARGEIQEKIGY